MILLCRYAAPMYCDVKHTVHVKGEDGPQETDEGEELDKVFLGEVGTCASNSTLTVLRQEAHKH